MLLETKMKIYKAKMCKSRRSTTALEPSTDIIQQMIMNRDQSCCRLHRKLSSNKKVAPVTKLSTDWFVLFEAVPQTVS